MNRHEDPDPAPDLKPEPEPEPGHAGRAIELLGKVRSGEIVGSMLAPETRRSLVVLLIGDGVSGPEVAQILGVSDRTVERDRRAIRAAAAISHDPRLVNEMAGRLVAEAELAIQRIRRTARERDVEPSTKIEAEHRCFQILKDLVHSLQSLGHLPTAAHRIEADLTHRPAPIPETEELHTELQRLRQLAPGNEALAGLSDCFRRAEFATTLADIREAGPLDEDGGTTEDAEGEDTDASDGVSPEGAGDDPGDEEADPEVGEGSDDASSA